MQGLILVRCVRTVRQRKRKNGDEEEQEEGKKVGVYKYTHILPIISTCTYIDVLVYQFVGR